MNDEGPSPELVALAQDLLDRARAGETARVLAYVDAGAPVDLTDAHGNTLLMLAAYHGHADLVAGLAERGAHVDRLNDRGQSPLAGAVFKAVEPVAADDPVVAVLLAHGADPEAGSPSASATAAAFGRTLDRPGGPPGP